MKPNQSTKRRFVVDKLEFEVQGPTLSYRPTQRARTHQTVGAVGIAIIFSFLAYLVFKNKPLTKPWRRSRSLEHCRALALLVFALGLLFAIPLYLRGSSIALILDSAQKSFREGPKQLQDLSFAESVTVLFNSGAGDSVASWTVGVRGQGQSYYFPLLMFDRQAEGDRVAKEISNHLNLPVS